MTAYCKTPCLVHHKDNESNSRQIAVANSFDIPTTTAQIACLLSKDSTALHASLHAGPSVCAYDYGNESTHGPNNARAEGHSPRGVVGGAVVVGDGAVGLAASFQQSMLSPC